MKLLIKFKVCATGLITCEQTWSEFDPKQVRYFSSNAINQDLDNFIKIKGDEPTLTHSSENYIETKRLTFKYVIEPKFTKHIGSHRSLSLNMPFSNQNEFFMGDSCILRPFDAKFNELINDSIELEIINETNLSLFTSIKPGAVDREQLILFFCYLCHARENVYSGKNKNLSIQIVQSESASKIISAKELFLDVNSYLNYYVDELGNHKQKELIIFQNIPDPNFQKLNNGKTFATGENVRNGILIYLPNDGDYLQWLAGHRDYLRELRTGLIHEIGHFYSSKGGDPNKTILTHDKVCPERDYWIIGENLNGYFTSFIAKSFGVVSSPQDFKTLAMQNAKNYKKRKGYAGCLYFCFVDKILKDEGTSLWVVYKEMIRSQRENPTLYKSIEYFYDCLEGFCSENIINKIKEVFKKSPEQLIEEIDL